MKKSLVIADDFTGANDTGVQLTKRGIDTYVVLDGKNIVDDSISYVLDTESRGLSEEAAYDRLKSQLKDIFKRDFDMVYKKVDSTLRGNITSELKAIDEEYKPDLIIFAPAFPDSKRTTVDGIHYVNGTRIKETEFAKDPIKPVREDNIQKLIELGYLEKVIHHRLEEIRGGSIDLDLGKIHTFDAEDNTDLEKIVTSVMKADRKVLWVGSAGLANIILKVNKPLKPVLSVVGSLSEISRKQIKYAESKGIEVLKIDIGYILKGKSVDEYVDEVVEVLEKGKDIIITSSYDLEQYREAIRVGEELSMTKEEVTHLTQDVLGKISEGAVKKVLVSGLFITGGDTAMGFIKRTKAKGSHIVEEVETGVPLMELSGGEFNGLKLITKAGAFGREETLYNAIDKLKEER